MKKITVITGAGSGLGREFAVQYALYAAEKQCCDELWLIARRRTALEAVKTEISAEIDGTRPALRIAAFDIGGAAGTAYFEKLLAKERSCNAFSIVMLINNAGFGVYGSFRESCTEAQLGMIDVNCYAVTGFCAAVLPFMERRSCIINTASMAAFLPVGNFAVYAATKAYVLSFSLALRNELRQDGIKVLALCPGQVDTGFAKRAVNSRFAVMRGAQKPGKIVAHCLACAEKNKSLAVWGLSWKIQASFSRFIGRNFFAWLTFRYVKRIQTKAPLN